MKNKIVSIILLCVVLSLLTFTQTKKKSKPVKKLTTTSVKDNAAASKPLITFIELGSVNCIPCKAMQKVMKAVEEKYGDQLRIIFYDVWTPEQAPFARKYNIRLIPTQVFLDANGKELMRHEGFFPEKDIDTFLQSKGLKSITTEKG